MECLIFSSMMYSFFMQQNTDVDSEGGSLPSDSLIRSGSAGMTSTIKPIKEGYLTKKGAVVGAIRLQVLVAGMFFFFRTVNLSFKSVFC